MGTTDENKRRLNGGFAATEPALSMGMIEPLAVRLPRACELTGFSRTEIYRRAGWPDGTPGRIVLLKCGNSTLVEFASLRAAVSGLPEAKIAAPRQLTQAA